MDSKRIAKLEAAFAATVVGDNPPFVINVAVLRLAEQLSENPDANSLLTAWNDHQGPRIVIEHEGEGPQPLEPAGPLGDFRDLQVAFLATPQASEIVRTRAC